VLGWVLRNSPSLDLVVVVVPTATKGLQHCLHQLVLVSDELLDLRVGFAGLVVAVAAMAIAVVPCAHHLLGL
jgi:hypothetical protein